MSSKQINKPLALAVGAALVGGLALSASAFAMTDLGSGYMVGASTAGAAKAGDKQAEANCGADKQSAEGKCGEGKCGVDVMDTDKDGKVSSAEFGAKHNGDTAMFAMHDTNKDGFITADEMKAHKEAGEAKCGADKKATDKPAADKPAGEKAKMEGKCGEGKCGGSA
ncbi:hypothetical protein GCM10027431_30390 [Lysobacter rhizosphaerae]